MKIIHYARWKNNCIPLNWRIVDYFCLFSAELNACYSSRVDCKADIRPDNKSKKKMSDKMMRLLVYKAVAMR